MPLIKCGSSIINTDNIAVAEREADGAVMVKFTAPFSLPGYLSGSPGLPTTHLAKQIVAGPDADEFWAKLSSLAS
jgi:hypothetical protein